MLPVLAVLLLQASKAQKEAKAAHRVSVHQMLDLPTSSHTLEDAKGEAGTAAGDKECDSGSDNRLPVYAILNTPQQAIDVICKRCNTTPTCCMQYKCVTEERPQLVEVTSIRSSVHVMCLMRVSEYAPWGPVRARAKAGSETLSNRMTLKLVVGCSPV